LPSKRPLEADVKLVDLSSATPPQKVQSCSERSPAKQPRLELQRNMEILSEVMPETLATKSAETLSITAERPELPGRLPSLRGPKPNLALEKAVEVAMQLLRDGLTAYALEKDLKGESSADVFAEKWAAEHYEEMKSAILGLLPWTGEMKEAPNGSYDIISFQGRKTPRREMDERQLMHFRKEGAQARAWEALCAVLAAISSRKEKIWLEQHDLDDEIADLVKTIPGCKSKTSAKRRQAIRDMIPKLVAEGAGGFAESLIDPRGLHQVTFARRPSGLLPATSMWTRRMPLWDALKSMDDEGPLRGAAADKEWCHGAGREFVFQDLQFGWEETAKARKARSCPYSRKERISAKDLKADKQLRDLLRSKKPVILLDTLAALAPRSVFKDENLSKIVTDELHALCRDAKARGEAVVFTLGSDRPHKLAQRVYLRPPLADYGMRCGCFRWRESCEVPWAREFKWDDRITLCLQMP
jgi:hypothetical protein